MAATATVAQVPPSRKSPINNTGVLTLSGFGVRVSVRDGHLEIEDGVGLKRRQLRLPRVGHGLKRLVVVGKDGFVTLSALQWIADQNASLSFLDRTGKLLFISGPTASSDVRLRRAQALANESGAALRIANELINRKLLAQARVVENDLHDAQTAQFITETRQRLSSATSFEEVRLREAHAAGAYWNSWRSVPVNFPKRDLSRIPDHWKSFGTRCSPLTGSPRLAVNPANAMLNYLYALLESEARLAAAALGLDPGIGMMHFDLKSRDSLASDLMEPIRPEVDVFLLHWLRTQVLAREWFYEERNGNCRLRNCFISKLTETLPNWRRAVAPIAEWVAQYLWSMVIKRSSETSLATPLTENNRRASRGSDQFDSSVTLKAERICKNCGKPITRRTNCGACGREVSRENMIEIAKRGRVIAHGPEAQARMALTNKRHAAARARWQNTDQPKWLTEKFYVNQIRPRLESVQTKVLRTALGVSECYALNIRKGKVIPHPMHWSVLAQMTNVPEK